MEYLLFACRFQNGGNTTFLLHYINVNQTSLLHLYSQKMAIVIGSENNSYTCKVLFK